MQPVLTKRDFVRRYIRGEFGNTGQQWNTIAEWRKSGYKGLVHIRSRRIAGAGSYNVPSNLVARHWNRIPPTKRNEYYLAAMAPHEHNLLQGEVQLRPSGLYLYYSTAVGLPMRDALALHPSHAHGIIALGIIKSAMCANSYEWLQTLFDNYPEHVIEFSTFSVNWGVIPNHNTVFWEVRKY